MRTDIPGHFAARTRNADLLLASASLPALVIQLAHASGRYDALTTLIETRRVATHRGPGLGDAAMDALHFAAEEALADYRTMRAAYVAAGGDEDAARAAAWAAAWDAARAALAPTVAALQDSGADLVRRMLAVGGA